MIFLMINIVRRLSKKKDLDGNMIIIINFTIFILITVRNSLKT